MHAVLAPQARRELLRIVDEMSAGSPAAARAFRKAVEAAALRLGEHPFSSPQRTDLAPEPWRFTAVGGFPYFLIYRPDPGRPLIVRVIHQRRDLENELRDLHGP